MLLSSHLPYHRATYTIRPNNRCFCLTQRLQHLKLLSLQRVQLASRICNASIQRASKSWGRFTPTTVCLLCSPNHYFVLTRRSILFSYPEEAQISTLKPKPPQHALLRRATPHSYGRMSTPKVFYLSFLWYTIASSRI